MRSLLGCGTHALQLRIPFLLPRLQLEGSCLVLLALLLAAVQVFVEAFVLLEHSLALRAVAVGYLRLRLAGLEKNCLVPPFVRPLGSHGLHLRPRCLQVLLRVLAFLLEPGHLGALLGLLDFLCLGLALLVLELDLGAVAEHDGGVFLGELEGPALGVEEFLEVELAAHPLLFAVDFEGHLEVDLLGLVGHGERVVGERGEEAERPGEGDLLVRVGELGGLGLVHLDCALAALGLLGAQPEDRQLQLQALLELGLQRQRLEVQRDRPVYDHYITIIFLLGSRQQAQGGLAPDGNYN